MNDKEFMDKHGIQLEYCSGLFSSIDPNNGQFIYAMNYCIRRKGYEHIITIFSYDRNIPVPSLKYLLLTFVRVCPPSSFDLCKAYGAEPTDVRVIDIHREQHKSFAMFMSMFGDIQNEVNQFINDL